MIEPRREREDDGSIDWTCTCARASVSRVVRLWWWALREARTRARAHTEERNLSLTRILNGCAEARTVGTHYSTTHPPPLSQNSTSSYCSFSFSFSPPSVYVGPARLSLFLSPSHPGPPCPHFGGGWFFRLAPPSVPLSTPLPFSQRTPRATAKLYSYILHTCSSLLCACHTYMCIHI